MNPEEEKGHFIKGHFIVEAYKPTLEVQFGQPFTPFAAEDLPELKDVNSLTREFKIPGIGKGEVRYFRDPDLSAISFDQQRIFLPTGEVSVVYQNLPEGKTKISYPFELELTLEGPERKRPDCLVDFLSSNGLITRFLGRDFSTDESMAVYYFLPEGERPQQAEWQDWGDIFLPDNPESLADLRITFLENSQ